MPADEVTFLFDPQLIEQLNWPLVKSYGSKLDSSLKIRPLRMDDFDRGHLKILSQLSVTGSVSREEYEERFRLMKKSELVKVVVIEDVNQNQIAGCASLFCEPKFTHNCSWVGHVQDVVVDKEYRGKGLGKTLVVCLKLLAMEMGAYKMDLDCADDKISFYKSLGFGQEPGRANYLTCRFERETLIRKN